MYIYIYIYVWYKIPPAEVYKRTTLPGLFSTSNLVRRLAELSRPSELPYCSPGFSSHELLHPSIGLLQMLSELRYLPIFCSDRLFSESLPDFFQPRSTLLRTSFGLHQRSSFPNSRTSTVIRLHPSFYGGRPPFGFLPNFLWTSSTVELPQ